MSWSLNGYHHFALCITFGHDGIKYPAGRLWVPKEPIVEEAQNNSNANSKLLADGISNVTYGYIKGGTNAGKRKHRKE